MRARFIRIFKKAFLPNGYPRSVSDDYLEYQCWDSAQAFASSIMNNLSTLVIFQGFGVGDANATALAATMTWFLKDGTSIIGSLVFATIQSTRMDSDCKLWRLFADIINDVAISIDLLSSFWFRHYHFILGHCFSGMLRSLVGIAGGATRAALTQHQAKRNNLADVSAKDQSQERIVNLLALIFSLVLVPMVVDWPQMMWTMFTLFTFSHIYFNYRAVRSVRIDVFNAKRLAIFLSNYFDHNVTGDKMDKLLSVAAVNREENVWFFLTGRHDRIFDRVRFVPNDSKTLTGGDRYKDLRNRFEIFRCNETDHWIVKLTDQSEPLAMIEALCVIFVEKRFAAQDHQSIHRNHFPRIMELFDHHRWNLAHVLMAEMIDEENSDHQKTL